jgi:nitroimidazol reductase NimA-like FMN-containing flavoprotein (pyridoxamine 5'-phosphate oxidase superfamily)
MGADLSPRTRVRRLPARQVADRAALHAVLDAARVAHVAVVEDGQPYVVPLAYGRDGDRVVVHGSTGSRTFRALAAGAPSCLTVTLLDGLVLARAAFETSMRYRSAMVLGTFEPLTDPAEKGRALEVVSDHSAPGRYQHLRPPTPKELAATSVLALPLQEWSVKASTGWPDDAEADLSLPVWAGVVPFRVDTGPPLPAPDLPPGVPVPDHVRAVPAPGGAS